MDPAPIRVRRDLTMPCCHGVLELQLAFDQLPTPGTTVNVECPLCHDHVDLVLYPIPVHRN